jgi:hypothetical protein
MQLRFRSAQRQKQHQHQRLKAALENLRGVPNKINAEVHLSAIATEWNAFYRQNASVTLKQLVQKAAEIDAKYGFMFRPPM